MLSVRTLTAGLALFALGLCGSAPSAGAGQGFSVNQFGVLGGFVRIDEDLGGPDGPTFEPALGWRLGGGMFLRRLDWFVDAQYFEVDTETFRGEARAFTGRAGLELNLTPERLNSWFIYGAVGHMRMSFDNALDFSSGVASAGVGQSVWLSGATSIRWELRTDHTLADNGLTGEDVTQPQFLVGVNWKIGPRPVDTDGDRIIDRRDRCPDTAAGIRVDHRGCALDADADGVLDKRDRCPGTAAGSEVDRRGCPLVPVRPGVSDRAGSADLEGGPADADSDAVPDDVDQCPGTLRGVDVDENGCPADEDGDGVFDQFGMDQCPGTPRGATVDVHGCPLDGDGDGVYDGLDRCPETAPGTEVDERGCPRE